MSDRTKGYNPTSEQQQNMDNLSFDRKYLINASLGVIENEAGDNIVRLKQPMKDTTATDGSQITKIKETSPTDSTKLNPSLTVTETQEPPLTTKTLTKTIGEESYVKTVIINSNNNSVSVSEWSKV